MFKRILIPVDDPILAEGAIQEVENLARQGLAGEVILLSVAKRSIRLTDIPVSDLGIGMESDMAPQWREQLHMYEDFLNCIEVKLRSEGIKVQSTVLEGRRPAHDIAKFAHQSGVDLILMTTHGYRGLKRIITGSVAAEVVHESRVPVFVIRPNELPTKALVTEAPVPLALKEVA